jgi:hypothetical protein
VVCSTHGRNNICTQILVCEVEGKRQFGTPRRRWKENIRVDLREVGWEGVDWMHLDQDRDQWRALVSKVVNLRVP